MKKSTIIISLFFIFTYHSYAKKQDSLISPLIISIYDNNYEFEISKKKFVDISIKCALQNRSDDEIFITRPYFRLNPYWIKIDSTVIPLYTGILNTVGYGIDTFKLKSGDKVDFDISLTMNIQYLYNVIKSGTYNISIKYEYNLEKIKMFYKVGFGMDCLPQELEELINKIDEVNTGWSNKVNVKLIENQKRKTTVNKN